MPFDHEDLPTLSESVVPPLIRGTADLAGLAYQGQDFAALLERIGGPPDGNNTGWLYDRGLACQLSFRRGEGLDLQDAALAQSPMFRVRARETSPNALRLLALCAPGDLMVNTPLDFITNELDVRLDLLYLLPGEKLPAVIPEHDVAFFAVGEAEPLALARLWRLFDIWPRPALNNPAFLPAMARDTLSLSLAGVPGICSPPALAVSRAELERNLLAGQKIMDPCLIRPANSHAGAGLSRAEGLEALRDYLLTSFEQNFYLTRFEDYAGPDGLYRKLRVAFIDRHPFLCHMAVSSHWMVHYLNAGMTESAEKRAMEAEAMATFDDGFARRHEAAFGVLHERLGFDYYSIDCAETRDGRLLVFEADNAAIVHSMDPPEMFPYKRPQMQKVYEAFGAMLRRVRCRH